MESPRRCRRYRLEMSRWIEALDVFVAADNDGAGGPSHRLQWIYSVIVSCTITTDVSMPDLARPGAAVGWSLERGSLGNRRVRLLGAGEEVCDRLTEHTIDDPAPAALEIEVKAAATVVAGAVVTRIMVGDQRLGERPRGRLPDHDPLGVAAPADLQLAEFGRLRLDAVDAVDELAEDPQDFVRACA